MKYKNLYDLYFLIKKKKISCLDLCKFFLKRIEKKNKDKIFIEFNYEKVLVQSKYADKLIMNNKSNLLTGIPICFKDNFLVKNYYVTVGSNILKNYKSLFNSTLIKKLKNLGMILLGKNNMNEFGLGSNNINLYYGNAKNCINKFITPGGSSGASASAVYNNLIPAAIATDTGGSVIQPSSFNSVIGFKPTYGRLSRYGIISYSTSLDTVGLITKNVLDSVVLLSSLTSYDIKDETNFAFKKENYFKYINKSWDLNNNNKKFYGLVVGVSKSYFIDILDYDIRSNLEYVLTKFEFLGSKIIFLCFSLLKQLIHVYNIISSCEMFSNLSRYDGFVYGYNLNINKYLNYSKVIRSRFLNNNIKNKLLLGNLFLSSNFNRNYFLQSKKIRRLLVEDFQRKFILCDFIITPSSPILPWYLYKSTNFNENFLYDIYTIVTNLLGLPVISIPSGYINKFKKKIPISFQIIGNYFKESRIFQISYEIQKIL